MRVAQLIICTLAVLTFAWLFRFDLVQSGDKAYKLDRWTGQVTYCVPFICSPTE